MDLKEKEFVEEIANNILDGLDNITRYAMVITLLAVVLIGLLVFS